jgi:hypothetical protein
MNLYYKDSWEKSLAATKSVRWVDKPIQLANLQQANAKMKANKR